MLTQSWLIDHHGSAVPSGAPALLDAAQASQFGPHFVDSALRFLGFVAVEMRSATAHVRLRLTHVTPDAVEGLHDWLLAHRPARLVVTHYADGRWETAILGAAETAADRLAHMILSAQGLLTNENQTH